MQAAHTTRSDQRVDNVSQGAKKENTKLTKVRIIRKCHLLG